MSAPELPPAVRRALTCLRWLPLALVAWNADFVRQSQANFRTGFLWELGIVSGWLVLLALLDFRSLRWPRWERSTWLGLLVLTAAGAFVRFWRLSEFPRLDEQVVEEVQTGVIAYRAIHWGGMDADFPLTELLAESSFLLFGYDMLGLRISFVIWSCLAVPALFLGARAYFRNDVVAYWVTLLFATNTYVVASGRTAMETFAPITTVVLALGCMFWAAERRHHFAYGLAGAVNGLLFVEYFSFRFVAVLNFLWLLLLTAQQKSDGPLAENGSFPRPSMLWAERGKVALYVALMISIALPCWVELGRGDVFNLAEGFNRNFVANVPTLQTKPKLEIVREAIVRIGEQASSLWIQGTHALVIPSERGIFDLGTTALGALASFYLFWRWRRSPVHWWPVLVPAIIVVAAACLTFTTSRYRGYCALPFFLFAIGMFLYEFRERRRAAVVASVVVGVLAFWNVAYFFGPTYEDPSINDENFSMGLKAGLEIKRQQTIFAGKLLVLDKEFYDEKGGEYAYLFDPKKMQVVQNVEALHQALSESTGPVRIIAINQFAVTLKPGPLNLGGTGQLRLVKRWKNKPEYIEQYSVTEWTRP